jgi:erythromycin esterase
MGLCIAACRDSFAPMRGEMDATPGMIPHTPAADSEVEARRALDAEYARIGTAISKLDLDAIRAVYTPGFRELTINGEESDLAELMAELKGGVANVTDFSYLVTIDTLAPSGSETMVVAKVTQAYTMSVASHRIDARHEDIRHDTWLRGDRGWHLSRSETHRSRTWNNGRLVSDETRVAPPTHDERADIVRDLAVNAWPFDTVRAGSGFDDLQFLDEMIGDARMVALGEASHGTAEFFRMKHRLLEYLVEKKGFSVLAMESPWVEGLATDQFIKTGEGGVAAALAGTHFSIWKTREVSDMLGWMRAYNLSRGDRSVLSFAGFDMQSTKAAAALVLEYVDGLGAVGLNRIPELYRGVEMLDKRHDVEIPAAEKLRFKDNAVEAIRLLEAFRGSLPDVSSVESYRNALQAARIVLQACEMHSDSGGLPPWAVRERSMAENVKWLLEERFPGQKIVLWAHNGHVRTTPYSGIESQGTYLRAWYGAQMVVLGFASHHGDLRARRMVKSSTRSGPYLSLPLAPARPASAEGLFHATGLSRFVLDFRRIPRDSALARWLEQPRLHRSIGDGYDPEADDAYEAVRLPKLYDGMVFIAESTAARACA